MTRATLKISLGMIVAFLLAIAGSAVTEAAGGGPNTSIFFYRPGLAVTGVLQGDRFVRKGRFPLKGVSLAAASRSSLALYTASTGRLRTGTFRGGVYKPVKTRKIGAGFTHVAASCDTVLFYDAATGRTLSGTLTGGRLRNIKTFSLLPAWRTVVASCDTIWFLRPAGRQRTSTGPSGGRDVVEAVATLEDGQYFDSGPVRVVPLGGSQPTLIAATADSWLAVEDTVGLWGRLSAGQRGSFTSTSGFATWDILAGTSRYVFAYRASGQACMDEHVDGVRRFVGCRAFPRGYTVITGGR